jgi:1,4-alpha-glucan branching enzyme
MYASHGEGSRTSVASQHSDQPATELEYWRDRLKEVDGVLSDAAITLILVGDRWIGKPEQLLPSWISDSENALQRSLLVHALCCSTLQRLWRTRRRYPWLTKKFRDPLQLLQERIALQAAELGNPDGKRPLTEVLTDPVFRNLNPFVAAETLWILLHARQNLVVGPTGFLVLFSMLWALFGMHSPEHRHGLADTRGLPASITAKCLLPITELQNMFRVRARLYRGIRDVCRSLKDFERSDTYNNRWKFACGADQLAGLMLEMSKLAINPKKFTDAAETISAYAAAMRPADIGMPWKKIRKLLIEVISDLGTTNEKIFNASKALLDRIRREILPLCDTPKARKKLDTNLRPRRADETQEAYWLRVRKDAEAALERCDTAVQLLQEAVKYCAIVEQETVPPEMLPKLAGDHVDPVTPPDPLEWVLVRIAEVNESLADQIEHAVSPATQWCRFVVRQEVAYASAGNDTEFDAAELLSAVGISERWGQISELEVEDAIAKALRGLRSDGSWSAGQPIYLTKRVLGVWPNTSDIGWLLAGAVRGRPKIRCADEALVSLVQWLDRTKTKFARHLTTGAPGDDDRRHRLVGWSSETRESKTIDLWITAGCVNALLETREIIEHRLWEICEKRFVILRELKPLDDIDPVDLGATHEHRLHHRLRNASRQTGGDDYANAEYSFVFHGPPGSSKTALAEALGQEMWREHQMDPRVIRITPADFTRQGEAGVDFEARFIFDLLSRVRAVTIIFDEIDDLLRRREKKGNSSFLKMIIPAMLNRLQDLRDAAPRQELCYIIAMNYVDAIEPALVRPGRIDAAIPIVYPDPWSRDNTLDRILQKEDAVALFDDRLRARIVTKTAGWPWSTYNRMCTRIVAGAKKLTTSTRSLIEDIVVKQLDRFSRELQDAASLYRSEERWSETCPPLRNEVAHFALAYNRRPDECVARIEEFLGPKLGPVVQQVTKQLFDEWRSEGRQVYTRDASDISSAFGLSIQERPRDESDETTRPFALFRVWAAGSKAVSLRRDGHEDVPMQNETEERFTVELTDVTQEDRYAYVLDSGEQVTDPYGRLLSDDARFTVAQMQDPAPNSFDCPGWDDLVLYQLDPGMFGGYEGLRHKLHDIEQLGINGIDLIGPGEFPATHAGAYDFAASHAAEKEWGGVAALRSLIEEAHSYKIAVIAGLTSHEMLGRPVADLMKFGTPSHRIYFEPDDPTETGPRADVDEPLVRELMLENARRWTGEIGVDGIRWAGTNFIRNRRGGNDRADNHPVGYRFLRDVTDAVRSVQRRTISIAQDMQEMASIVSKDANRPAFGAQWSRDFTNTVRQAVTDPDFGLAALKKNIESFYYTDPYWRVLFSESHRTVQQEGSFAAQLRQLDPQSWHKRAFLAAAIALVSPGIPMILQGQEYGDLLPLDRARRFEPTERAGRAIYSRFSQLIGLRRNRENLTPGLRGHHLECTIDDANRIMVLNRWHDGSDNVIVVMNFGNREKRNYPVHFPLTGPWFVHFNPDCAEFDGTFGICDSGPVIETDPTTRHGVVSIGPMSLIVLSHVAPRRG